MNGFINLIKPEGMSSAYAVGLVKKKFHCPCGHMGTLDPMASGVLPVGLNHASRLFPFLMDKEKTYVAEFRFGISTDTLDITGETQAKTNVIPKKEEILQKLSLFVGEIEQMPPKFSAKYVNGKRGYELARNGVDFTLSPKKVNVLSFTLDSQISETDFKFIIKCKGGTYIRSLARDLGEALGSLAVMTKLCREKSGVFCIENGVTYEQLEQAQDVEKFVLPADIAVDFTPLILTSEQATKTINGVFNNYGFADGVYRVYNGTEFWGVGTAKGGVLKMNAYVK